MLIGLFGFMVGMMISVVFGHLWFKKNIVPVLERVDLLKREISTLKERYEKVENEKVKFRKEKVEVEDRFLVMNEELGRKLKKSEEQERLICELQTSLNVLNAEIVSARDALEKANIGNSTLHELVKKIRTEKDVVMEKLGNATNELKVLSSQADIWANREKQYLDDVNSLKSQRGLALKENEKLMFRLREAVSKLTGQDAEKKNVAELMHVLDTWGFTIGGDEEVVKNFMRVTGEQQILSLPEEDAEIGSRPTQKLNALTIRELLAVAPTIKLSSPDGAKGLILESLESFVPDGFSSLVTGPLKSSENSCFTQREMVDILTALEVLPKSLFCEVTTQGIDALFDEIDNTKKINWNSFPICEKEQLVFFLSSEMTKSVFEEGLFKSVQDVLELAVMLVKNTFGPNFFDLNQINPVFLGAIINSEKYTDLEKKLVSCVDKILAIGLSNQFKHGQKISSYKNKYFFLKKVAHGYFLVNALGSTKHLAWIVKFCYLFFEILRLQSVSSLNKLDFFDKLALKQDFEFLNKFKIVAGKSELLKYIEASNLFPGQDGVVLAEALEAGNLIDVFARIYKKATFANDADNLVLMDGLEKFMVKIVLSYSEESVTAKAV